jgi:5-methylthioadenosine/S-adenosylhomocysteine deaminase
MLFKNISVVDEKFNILTDMYVGVDGGIIEYIGRECPSKVYNEVYDGMDKLLISGFYNMHGHTAMTLLRGYAENYALQDWLYNHIFPFEAKLTDDDCYYSTLLGAAEMLKSGVVSVSDMYGHTMSVAQAFYDSGMKANISNGLMCFDKGKLLENSGFLQECRVREKFNNKDGRIICESGCHAEYTSDESFVKEVAAYCQENNLSVHIHLSETKNEYDECVERHGISPCEYFEKNGLFNCKTTAAHCVWLNDNDLDILYKNNVTVAHNPVSNLKLASGVARVTDMLKKGINVTIGTDGCASNNSLDMFDEMKTFGIVHKGFSGDPTVVGVKDILKCSTVNGAIAQGRKDCGCIKVGNKADIAVIDMSHLNMQPVHNALNNIVYSANSSNVALTMVDGKVLYKNGEFLTIDTEMVLYEVNKAKERICNDLAKG